MSCEVLSFQVEINLIVPHGTELYTGIDSMAVLVRTNVHSLPPRTFVS